MNLLSDSLPQLFSHVPLLVVKELLFHGEFIEVVIDFAEVIHKLLLVIMGVLVQ